MGGYTCQLFNKHSDIKNLREHFVRDTNHLFGVPTTQCAGSLTKTTWDGSVGKRCLVAKSIVTPTIESIFFLEIDGRYDNKIK